LQSFFRKIRTGVDESVGSVTAGVLYSSITLPAMNGTVAPSMEPSISSEDGLSGSQKVALEILWVFSSALSTFGSCTLCYLILITKKSEQLTAKHRLLFGISIIDIIASIRHLVAGLRKNDTEPSALCTASGYVTVIAMSAPLYNMFLALYYQATICSGVSQETFSRSYERWCHAFAILYPFIIGTAGLFFTIYNPSTGNRQGCTIRGYPSYCAEDDDIECTRGEHAYPFAYSMLIPFLFIFPVLIVSNVLIYLHVRNLERRSSRFSMLGESVSKTKKVATQCLLYVLVFFLCWIWGFVGIYLEIAYPDAYKAGDYYAITVLESFFYPLQGAGNLLIFLRPTYIYLRDSGHSRWGALRHIMSPKDHSSMFSLLSERVLAVSQALSSVQFSLLRRGSDAQRGGEYSFTRADDLVGGGDSSKIGEVPETDESEL
jgi:hypothetical protein